MTAGRQRARRGMMTSKPASKDKRYHQQVEKVLVLFDAIEEWADYISFLSKLQKLLQLGELASPAASLPHTSQIAHRLALCLSAPLPNGVHQKALSLYELILAAMPTALLEAQINVWLPGLLPVLSYCLTQLKPMLLQLYQSLIERCSPAVLQIVAKPLILALLPGLDDENSETFAQLLAIVDLLKRRVANDCRFWQAVFLCIINNPERRLGALVWCNKRLPHFAKTLGKLAFAEEAQACVSPEPGLLIRAFATLITLTQSMIAANDIIVVRGFFDLLLSNIPLDCHLMTSVALKRDREMLVRAGCSVTLKKDMSLNRRLWNWLLGPDLEGTPDAAKISRSHYFEQFGLPTLSLILLEQISAAEPPVAAVRVAVSLVLDKWEISRSITPVLFLPIMRTAMRWRADAALLTAAKSFFDSIEAMHIWNDLNRLIWHNEELSLVEFVLLNFDIGEDEMRQTHIPLAAVGLAKCVPMSVQWVNVMEALLEGMDEADPVDQVPEITPELVSAYYDSLVSGRPVDPPTHLHLLVSTMLRTTLAQNLTNHAHSISAKLCDLFLRSRTVGLQKPLIDNIMTTVDTDDAARIDTAFNLVRLLPAVFGHLSLSQRDQYLKTIMTGLFHALTSPVPSYHQVEAVKAIFGLEEYYSKYQIEAGILKLLSANGDLARVRALSNLWTHSANLNGEVDSILSGPVFAMMDESELPQVVSFIRTTIVKGGLANRLLKILTNPLLGFELLSDTRRELAYDDDVYRFAYYINTLCNVIAADERPMRDSLNNELVVMDSADKVRVINTNSWDVSTYKTLVLHVMDKFLDLRPTLADADSREGYVQAVSASMRLYCLLISGYEADFVTRFFGLVENCTALIDGGDEMVVKEYLEAITAFLKLSHSQHVNLNLLHNDDVNKDPEMVRFLTKGIKTARSRVLLESWIALLTKTLYIFNESVFSVLLTLNDAMVHRLEDVFDCVRNQSQVDYQMTDAEGSIAVLIGGLEDLLTISHSYLLTSGLRAQGGAGSGNGTPANGTNPGFFGNVIQGVFLIESPAIRSTEENKKYSILLAFHDAVSASFQIWHWAESNAKEHTITLAYIARKLKFKARKLLEALIELERQEVIESLISISSAASPHVVKLLHVLDGGRSQITLPNIYNSILTRCYPAALDEKHKSSMNCSVSANELSAFLPAYIQSVDEDTVPDIWSPTVGFFKEVNAHPTSFRKILPDSLKTIVILMTKVAHGRPSSDPGKGKRDLSDLFAKLLSISVRVEGSGGNEKEREREKVLLDRGLDRELTPIPTEKIVATQSELTDALALILSRLSDIVADQDKVTSCINTIMVNLVAPQIKNKRVYEIAPDTVTLIAKVGNAHPSNKAWKAVVLDCFMDNSFFHSASSARRWIPVLQTWISNDKDRVADLVSKLTPVVNSAAANIFNWNESSEIDNKVYNVKRLIYLVLIQPTDYFLNHLEQIFENSFKAMKTGSSSSGFALNGFGGGDTICPPLYKSELLLLLRAVTLKFSELHLLSQWTNITFELQSNFEDVRSKSLKDLSLLTPQTLAVVLSNCKLLDQLLLLRYDEFNLSEWLFVASSSDLVTTTSTTKAQQPFWTRFSSVDTIGDELSSSKELAIVIDPLNDADSNEFSKPLLFGVTSIDSVFSLRLFFGSLSLLHYERTFALIKADLQACIDDLLNDISSQKGK